MKILILQVQLRIRNISKNNPSVSFADSSLYTREPSFETSFFVLPHQLSGMGYSS